MNKLIATKGFVRSLMLVGCLILLSCVQDKRPTTFPKPVGYINDFAWVLSTDEEKTLTHIVSKHQKKSGNQIVVATVDSLYGFDNLFDCSLAMANEWEVGEQGKNNGVLILVVPSKRALHIQNGKGLVNKLTNEETKQIIDSVMIPRFKTLGYYDGLEAGIAAIINEIK